VFVADMANGLGIFQENKVMLGFISARAAINCLRRTCGPDYEHHVASISELSIPEVKKWIEDGGGKEPLDKSMPTQAGCAVDDDGNIPVFDHDAIFAHNLRQIFPARGDAELNPETWNEDMYRAYGGRLSEL
jgi:hypothetical protein